jgi:Fe-Mn family superoxide dismutase
MAYELPPLPYPKDALEPYIDAQTMEIHHDKHHGAYVTNVNKAIAGKADLESKTVEDLIRSLNAVPGDIRGTVRNNGGGHANHSMFWKLLAPKAGGAPSGKLGDDLNAAFGGFDAFKGKFEAAGGAIRQRVGVAGRQQWQAGHCLHCQPGQSSHGQGRLRR